MGAPGEEGYTSRWEARRMYPYINLGPLHLGTFGLLLWAAAAVATLVLHRNFERHGVEADALSIVAVVTIAGIVGAKLWNQLEEPHELMLAMRAIAAPGWSHPGAVLLEFFSWFKAGFAWFGGLLAGIVALMWSGQSARFRGPEPDRPGERIGAIRILDLATPAAAIGYGVGRIGCLTSGDGDYGINTTLPWGVRMMNGADQYHRALVLPTPPDALVQPTPIYELLFALAVFWVLWRLGRRVHPAGWMTGLYLVLSGVGRFLVEFVRINPKLYWGMSNAQVAALGSVVAGTAVMAWARVRQTRWSAGLAPTPRT